MPLTPGQLSYWRNRTGNPNLTAGQAERMRDGIARGPQGSLQQIPGAQTIGGGTRAATPTPLPTPPPPVDPVYDAQVANIGRRRDDTLAYLGTQERDVRREFGFDDTSDPFSRARLLQRSFEQNQRGATNSYASRGQLYSGALQNAQNEVRFGFERGLNAERREYDRVLADIGNRRRGAQTASTDEELDAAGGRVDRAAAQRPDPYDFAGGGLTSGAPAFRPPTTPRRRRRRPRR